MSLPVVVASALAADSELSPMRATEHQVTHGPGGRILSNTGVWSPDGEWIVHDTRSDPAGDVFDGTRIECGEFSPLLAGDLSPSNGRAHALAPSRWTRLCFGDESPKRQER